LFEGAAIMQEAVEIDHAWPHIMAHLGADGCISPRHQCPIPAEYRADSHRRCVIKLLERQGPTAATVSWSDPTTGCYGEQRWRRDVARKSGVCAMSGQTIAKRDAVYRPRRVQPTPRNIEAMILASVMETIPLADVV
jgi:hypothetical protein